jgi:hypothetical protein
MAITFREAVAEVELGLVSGDQLPDIATAGLLEGYQSAALATLAGQFGEPYDPIDVERLWSRAMEELQLPVADRTAAARTLVRAYARMVSQGELPPRLGASKILGVHAVAGHAGCDRAHVGDCIDAARIIGLFYAHDDCGYRSSSGHADIDQAIACECRRLAELQG